MLYQAPDLLLADEPVSALDPTLADAAIGELVAQSEATGATLVASLHAVDLALKWFDRIVGMRDGEVVFDAPAERGHADRCWRRSTRPKAARCRRQGRRRRAVGPRRAAPRPCAAPVLPLMRPGCR